MYPVSLAKRDITPSDRFLTFDVMLTRFLNNKPTAQLEPLNDLPESRSVTAGAAAEDKSGVCVGPAYPPMARRGSVADSVRDLFALTQESLLSEEEFKSSKKAVAEGRDNLASEIRKLADLWQDGLYDRDEFVEAKRAEISRR